MKKKFFIPVILIGMMIVGFASFYQIGDPNADTAPAPLTYAASPDTITVPPFPFPTLFNFNYASVPGMNAGSVGAMFFNGKYYFNRWNSSMMYRYNNNGPGGAPGTLADSFTYVGSCRDLTSDGTYLYGGPASTTLYRIDPNTGANLKTITLAGGGISRAIAWDPNRKGFWSCNFAGNLFLNDTNGALVKQIAAGNTIAGKYGMGWDSSSVQDSAFLWVWSQDFSVPTDTTNKIHKININTGAIVGIYTVNINGVGIAGGAEVIANAIPGKLVLLCNYQNYALVGYNLKDLATPPVTKVWSEQVSTLTTELNSVSAVDDNVAWSSGAAGKVVRTTNKGVLWTNVSGDLPTANAGYVIWAFNANSAVVTTSPSSGAGARIFKTTNGGVNWVQTFFQSDGWGDGFYFKNATTGFFYGDHTGTRLSIFKTTDAGTTWDSTGQYYPTTSDGWNNAMFGLGDQVWIGTNSTSIAYTSNAGVNWSTQTTTGANTYAIWFNSATSGLAGGASTMFQTTNSGTNWATLTSPVANNATGLCGTGSEYWFTTFSALVYYSSNNGTTWSTQYTAPSSTFRHITRSRTGSTIWGVRTDGGISRYGDPLVGITPISTEIPKNFSLGQNYPNPFNPTTKINFALPKSGLVSLKVYDMLGKEVATLVNEVKSAGTYAVDFNGTSLSSGMYFYKISVNGFSDVKKMLMIK